MIFIYHSRFTKMQGLEQKKQCSIKQHYVKISLDICQILPKHCILSNIVLNKRIKKGFS